ncbi:transposase, IS256 family [Cupriavidus taiwanensis]|uniref:Mutator family transposase n=1 Tax=Cupriavidus taiwanensis TaxID=164546 RepID=A0A375JBA3_9BURK|nr:transposase, IS256 family [Cupriavidus taiwanensis]
MPRRIKTSQAADRELPTIPEDLIAHFVKGPMTAEAVQDASMAFKKALIERALGAELGHHLGYAAGAERPAGTVNQRNGKSAKTLLTEDGPLRVDIPRDRDGSFDPILIPKHERRFTGFDDKIIAMYARGMTVREIQAFLAEQYGTEVSPEFISSVTDAVMDEVTAWQARPLEAMYPVVFFDALRVKMREDGVVRNKAVYLALGVLPDSVTDGVRGMEQALNAVFPHTTLQTCIVHLIRNSLEYASWKERRTVAAALKPVYTAPTVEAALAELEAFENGQWGQRYAPIGASWRRAWDQVIPFFTFPPAIRKIIYTTDEVDKRVVCFRSFMASVLVATERVPHLPAVALASSARTGVGKRARLARRPHAPDPARTSDCRRRQTPCGYRDAQEACLPAVPAHGSCAQSAPGDPRRRIRYA